MSDSLHKERFAEKTTIGLTRLMLAAKEGDLRRCLRLLEAGEIADEKTPFGVSLLHLASVNKKHGLRIVRHFPQLACSSLKDVDGEEPVHYAVRAGNFDLALTLLGTRNNGNLLHFFVVEICLDLVKLSHRHDKSLITKVDPEGRNALHLAAEHADPEICDWLICRGIDPKSLSVEKATALHHAVRNERHAKWVIRYLAAWKVDVDARTPAGHTPLQLALLLEKTDLAQELLNCGAEFEEDLLLFCVERNKIQSARFVHFKDEKQLKKCDSRGRNAVHVAAEKACREMCEWLVQVGVEVTALSGERKSCVLHHVGLNKQHGKSLVRFFTFLGFSLKKRDEQGETPLHYALRVGNLAVAEEMVRRGADLRSEVNGQNLLHFCVRQNNLKGAQFVNSKDKELIRADGRGGRNVMHLAAEFSGRQMCEWLLEEGARAFVASGEFGNNVLHFAALNQRHGRQLVQLFVSPQLGFKVHVRNKMDETPLHLALVCGNLEVADELLRLGADTQLKIGHENLLHFCACWSNTLPSAKFLHDRNQKLVKESCLGGMTPLHHAAQRADLEFCRWLVHAGVDVHARTIYGKTALDFVPRNDGKIRSYFKSLGMNT
ncbi:putative ankyrin repeat protein RF_0381 [Cloeon dipterum]|uniref:putative ankyrin repeat protein RF_0381 n=1 Tax=Cloeon dipterum TaxID=197152 RepID=UPI00321F9826